MSLSAEEIQSMADSVALSRLQEYFYISFFAFYFYYMLTTVDEEVAVIFPQRWNWGKTLFVLIRYGITIFIVLQLSRDYRTYFAITPKGCKALAIILDAVYHVSVVASDVALGLCLSAFLQVGIPYATILTILSASPSAISTIFTVTSRIQYPAEEASPFMGELGYPCYFPSGKQWTEKTITNVGRSARRYVWFATNTLLFILAIATLIVRYKGNRSRLVYVLRRDLGVYYIALAAIRFGQALVITPAIVAAGNIGSNPGAILLGVANDVVIPILAQQLLLNMRKVDYGMGSHPVASKLLFAHLPPDSDSELDGDLDDSLGIASEKSSTARHESSVSSASGGDNGTSV